VVLTLTVPAVAMAADSLTEAATAPTNRPAATNQLTEIVVTASRIARDIQSEPSATYRLDGQDAALREGTRTTPQMLDGVPSVMVQKTSYGQSSPYLRGFTGYRTLCMIDGIRLNNSAFRSGPNQYWSTVDLLSIAHSELVMGPGSVLYGSDAIGGTLNALTLDPPDWAGESSWERHLYYRGATAEGSSLGRVQLGGRLSEQSGFVGGYSLKSFGDLRGGEDVGLQEHTGYDEQDFDAKVNYYLSKNSILTLGHQTVRQDDAWRTHRTIYGIDWEGLSHGTDKVNSYDQARDLTYARFQATDLEGFADAVELTLSRHAQGEDLYRVENDDRGTRQGFDVETWGSTLQLQSQTAWGQWVYGLDYYHDIVDSYGRKYRADGSLERIEIQGPVADDASYDLAGIFAQDTISCLDGRLDVIPGFRYTFAAADADRVRDRIGGSQTSFNKDWQDASASLRLLLPLAPDRRHALYADVSQGFRAPSLSDLSSFDIARSGELEIPSTDLAPERYVTYEIGFKSRTDQLISRISYYYTTVDGMIVRTPTGRLTGDDFIEVTKRNAGDGCVQGVEWSETYRFTPKWSTWMTASWQDGRVDTYPSATAAEPQRDYISRLMPPTAELGLRWQSDQRAKYWCELVGKGATKADKLSAEDELDTQRIPPGGTPGYAACHVRAGTQLTRALALAVAVENVFDEDYRIHGSGVNEPGRNVILTAACDF